MGKKRPVRGGFSQENSISFFIDGHIVSSIHDKRGDKYRVVFELPKKVDESGEDLFRFVLRMFNTFLCSILSIWLQESIYFTFGNLALVRIFEMLVLVLMFVLLYIGMEQMLGKRKVLLNHGAEHKVYNAAGKAGRAPTLEEARKASRYSPWCGVKMYTVTICLLLINVILLSFNYIAIPLILVFWIGVTVPGYDPVTYLVQKLFTTREPSDEELELAIEAYKTAIEIDEGRAPTEDEAPSTVKAMDLIMKLRDKAECGKERLTDEEIELFELYSERIRIEESIIGSVLGIVAR